ncbi:DUF1624 domain-containing protein [Azospirillum soli]|uniref:DUF1624 domain-containing protein n=1 Tax=Azospirillum soli TaxID=1304799 RepID=UPI001AE1F5FE|nr:heparan-alpha-glucosaminide N-acetyltransferase [Azospirillum soli]MBP2313795.1 putative membrane protein [Azospirillum soli]
MPLLPPFPSSPATHRLPLIDAARGVALLAMAVYHASWDLTFLGLATFDLLTDPLWLAARTAILGSFLVLAGVSLALATERGLDRARFLRRLALLVLAAAAVSAMSYAIFPDSPIFFGVLHHIAVGSLLGLAFVRLPWPVTLALGVAVIAVGKTVALPLFDTPWLRWIGLMTFEPESNDYVPLFPWFGGVLIGIALGRLWRPRRGEAGPVTRGFAWAGRHSLAIYLIHQPILFGAFSLVALGIGVEPPDVRNFLSTCVSSCENGGGNPQVCMASCRCVVTDLERAGIWKDFLADRLSAADQKTFAQTVQACGKPQH